MGALERKPGVQNWIERLPASMRAAWNRSIVYRAAVHIAEPEGHMPVGMAIASALNWAQHICTTGDVKQWRGPQQVRPSSRAECCAAIALWKQMRATSKAQTAENDMSREEDPLRLVDLARTYLRFREGEIARLPRGATAAFLDLAVALPGGRFPIRDHTDVKNAIHAVGRARPATEAQRALVRRHVIARAKAVGATHLIPASWNADGSLK